MPDILQTGTVSGYQVHPY